MSEQRCGTCARWHRWDGTANGAPSRCMLTGLGCSEDVGCYCLVYLSGSSEVCRSFMQDEEDE